MKERKSSGLREAFGLFWRYCLLLPLTFPLGIALLFLVLAFPILPAGYAVCLFIEGGRVLASVVLVLWGAAMYLLRRLWSRLFEGSDGL
jgi:cytochrome c biogenesis protein CcdA